MKIKESRGRKIFKAFNYTFLALLGIATFYPFWYVLIASFNTGRDFMRGGGSGREPSHWRTTRWHLRIRPSEPPC